MIGTYVWPHGTRWLKSTTTGVYFFFIKYLIIYRSKESNFQPFNRAVKYDSEGNKTMEPAGPHVTKEVAEYNNAVEALMTASGVFKGNRDEL
jgi:hypothetical protein